MVLSLCQSKLIPTDFLNFEFEVVFNYINLIDLITILLLLNVIFSEILGKYATDIIMLFHWNIHWPREEILKNVSLNFSYLSRRFNPVILKLSKITDV